MVKVECPNCFKESFTASPSVRSKCSYCGYFFAGGVKGNDLLLDPSIIKRLKGLGRIRLNNNL